MADIMRIITKYEDMEAKSIASDPKLAHDIQFIGKHIDNLSGNEHKQAKETVRKILDAINSEIDNLTHQMQDHPAVLDRIQKNAQACLAYTKAKG